MTKPERDETENAERTIYQPPPHGNSPQRAEHERVGNQQSARDHSEREQPSIPHGIAQRSEIRDRNHEVAEREPIGSVKQKGIFRAGVVHGGLHAHEPVGPSGCRRGLRGGCGLSELNQAVYLKLQGNCRKTAEKQANDKQPGPDANPAAQRFFEFGIHAALVSAPIDFASCGAGER